MRSIWRVPMAAAMVVAFASGAWASAVGLPLDEYLCYQAKESKIPTQTKFKDLNIQVRTKDQFDATHRDNSVTKFVTICNPVQTGKVCPGPSLNPTIHLTEYAIKDLKAVPKYSPPASIYNLADCAGMANGVTISKPKSLLVRTNKIDYGPIVKCKTTPDCAVPAPGDTCQSGRCLPPGLPVPGANAMAVNTADYMCYSVKGPKGPFGSTPIGTDQFNYPDSYLLNKITKICAPTEKVNLPSATIPDGDDFAGHLICYQAKSNKTNTTKFVAHQVSTNNMLTPFQLEASKVTEYCLPALKAIDPLMPAYVTPTTLTTVSQDAGGLCGSLTTNGAASEGVPGRRNTSDALTSPNDCCTGSAAGTCNTVCTGVATPLLCCTGAGTGSCNACCSGADAGHCNEGKTVTCGSLTFGGGGPSVGNPGNESASSGGGLTRYNIACGSPDDTTCAISGNAGNLAGGVQCTTTGCGGVTPIDSTAPVKVCALNTLAAPGSTGNLNLVTGDISLTATTNATVYILTSTSFTDAACPRCRVNMATTAAEVFQTGPTTPGVGVCDTDSTNPNAPCFVFEPAGSGAGLTTDCTPDVSGGGSAIIAIGTTQTTAGTSVADALGHFCTGQAGNADCIAAGNPNICCTGAAMGSCNNFNGCFGSANTSGAKFADTPATCTGIAVTGTAPGILIKGGTDPVTTYGTVACIPAVNAGVVLSGLVNNNAGLPGPVVTSSKVAFDIN